MKNSSTNRDRTFFFINIWYTFFVLVLNFHCSFGLLGSSYAGSHLQLSLASSLISNSSSQFQPSHLKFDCLSMMGTSNSDSESANNTTNNSKLLQGSLDQAKKIISDAISIGAPTYNRGDIEGCATTYYNAAMQLKKLSLPAPLQTSLDNCIATYSATENVNDKAWGLRRQFDAILEYTLPYLPLSLSASDTNSYTMEPFTESMISSQPVIINDGVMGGLSQGRWNPHTQRFTGTTSLANNGGFSSIRWRMNRIQNWSYAKGIYLFVNHPQHPQHTFRLLLKDSTCEQVRGANFKNVFSNPYSSSSDKKDMRAIFLPFDAFHKLEQMGRTLGTIPFNRSEVTEIGIMAIKPTVVGDFDLQIQEWGLYY